MNRIRSIKIKNYRSCRDTSVEFYESLTTLVGINGSGKTNILSAISSLAKAPRREADIEQLTEILGRDPSVLTAELEIGSKIIILKAEFFTEFDEYHEKISDIRLKYRQRGKSHWRTISQEALDFARYISKDYSYNIRLRKIRKTPLSRADSLDYELQGDIMSLLAEITYFSATKFADPTKTPASIELRDDDSVFGLRRSGIHVEFLRDLNNARKDGVAFERYKDIVGPKGLGLVEDITIDDANVTTTSGKVLVGGQLQNRKSINRFIVPRVYIDGSGLSFSQLSEGTFKTLALVFYILNSDKQILLIEEPEVSVHHGLLASLIELIKDESESKQIIVSTHSDFVLNKLYPENIVIVTKNKLDGTLARPLDKAMQRSDFNYLKKYLNEVGNLGEYWRDSGFLNE